MSVLIDLKNRGVSDTFFVVCDGLKGHPRGRVERVAAGDRADTRHPPDPEHVRRSPPASTPTSSREDLRPIYTAVNATAARAAFDDLAEKWGQRYPAVIRLWDNAWAENVGVPRLRRRDPHRHLLDERHRELQRPLPAGGEGPRALAQRAGRPEVPLPGDPIPGPHRGGAGTMDHAVEASAQRVRDHLRRPIPGRRDLLITNARNTVGETVPRAHLDIAGSGSPTETSLAAPWRWRSSTWAGGGSEPDIRWRGAGGAG
jgi:hypothetical protein